ncbi:MAG: hypothetical protein P8012_05935 [Desulfobacterales bacterium]
MPQRWIARTLGVIRRLMDRKSNISNNPAAFTMIFSRLSGCLERLDKDWPGGSSGSETVNFGCR